jgi:hypothetical protein
MTYISRGYTIAFARTAPVAPATALPQGERRMALDWPVIVRDEIDCARYFDSSREVEGVRSEIISKE